jgi:hypothetical protein
MRRATNFILLLPAIFLVVQAAYSLRWPLAHDEAPLFYEAFLMQSEGRIPYRDIFDFQMPGSYVAYYLLGILSNFGAFRIRILDLFILITIIAVTWLAMRRFGRPAALAGGILFGLKYLQGGPALSFQREYLLLIFIAFALFVGLRDSLTFKHRLTLGILFGLSATIKPHAALGLLPFLLFDIADLRGRLGMSLPDLAKQSILPMAAGFLIPISLVVVWLAFTGALAPFLDVALNYWPLYSQINGEMAVTSQAERTIYLLNQAWRLGGSGIWLIPAAFGIYLHRNRQTYLLASLALCYAIYPALSGQFFPYHYIPFLYLIVLIASLSISSINQPPLTVISSSILLLALTINVRPSQTFLRQLEGKPIVTSSDRAVEIAGFLEQHLEAGDTVQPLDWTGGTLLAMLETRASLATSYVFDFYFHHHISDPYIQSLQSDFMTQLQETQPRFIIEVTAIDKPWVSGHDTSREFSELRAFLDEYYSITIQGEDYSIHELDGRP